MKQLLLIFLTFFVIQNGFTQIGISGTYNQINTPDWQPLFENSFLYDFPQDYQFPSTFGVAVDYWWQPLEYRIEFLPTLGFLKTNDGKDQVTEAIHTDFKLGWFDFSVPTRFYVLDMEGDCDCPTWGKDGSLIKKGFYLSLIPGLSYTFGEITNTMMMGNSFDQRSFVNDDIVAHLGIGVGLDIGVTKFLTLSPFVNYKRHFDVEWNQLNFTLTPESSTIETSPINQLQFGLRLGMHWKQ